MLVTSTLPEEGKTTTAINAARELARSGAKVLMIDANMRSPQLHCRLGMENNAGLSSILSQKVTLAHLRKMIRPVQDSNVSLLPSGIGSDVADTMFHPGRMGQVLRSVREEFNYIIIDSPPISAFEGAKQLSSLVDGVMVVKAQTTSDKDVQHTLELLAQLGVVIIQVVLKWR